MQIPRLLFLFSIDFAVGLIAWMPLVPFKKVGKPFYKYNALFALLLALLAGTVRIYGRAGWVPRRPIEGVTDGMLLLFVAGMAAILWRREGAAYTRICVGSSLCGTALIVADAVGGGGSMGWIVPFVALASALLLGAVNLAMILGHWYLNIPNLSIRPLRDLTGGLLVALTLRAFLVGVVLLGASVSTDRPVTLALGRLLSFWDQGMLLGVRVLFGIAAPFLLWYMVWASVRLRATQSATGILYAAVVLVVIGELISKYLFIATGLPL
ncbi:MAG: hypothetical protein D6812_10195 [Deltaproteobacteria bacterium]|nr:MAG: hypothetical protein D6812_10195 [Deltaproteobacteria bacterium]